MTPRKLDSSKPTRPADLTAIDFSTRRASLGMVSPARTVERDGKEAQCVDTRGRLFEALVDALGLLLPCEVPRTLGAAARAAGRQWRDGHAPLVSAGDDRIGWRNRGGK